MGADYAIGDIQGCYEPLMRLLDAIGFDEKIDRLWFVGDLVNRGPESLRVLRFIKNLPLKPRITLGNHDLHLLVKLFTNNPRSSPDDTLKPILRADDGEDLGHWLRKQSILFHDESLQILMCHAGIAPVWNLELAKALACELEKVLSSDTDYRAFLGEIYGNEPNCWSPELKGIERLRIITNYFTRMRLCDAEGCLYFGTKTEDNNTSKTLYPWFAVPGRLQIPIDVVFGHWAALQGNCPVPNLYALDTGCFWGGELTALRLQDRCRFSVKGEKR